MLNPLRRFRSYRLYVRTMPWLLAFYVAMFIGGFLVAVTSRAVLSFADAIAQFGLVELLYLLTK